MRLSEILLRLGCNLVGWLIIYSHCIWLALIPRIGCGVEADELFRLSLGFAPFTIAAALLLGLANKLTSVVTYLKWLAVPLILLLPMASIPVVTAFEMMTFGGLTYCESSIATGWQRAWAPIQIATLLIIVTMTIRFVIRRRQDSI